MNRSWPKRPALDRGVTRPRMRALLSLVASAVLVLAIAGDDWLAPRDLHLVPRLPAVVVALALLAVGAWRVRAERRTGRWLLTVLAGAMVTTAAGALLFAATGAVTIRVLGLEGESTLGAIVPALGVAMLGAPVGTFLLSRWWTVVRGHRGADEAAALTLESVSLLLVAVTAWGLVGGPVGWSRLGETPLVWASREGHPGIVRFLLSHGGKSEGAAATGRSPLVEALSGCPRHHRPSDDVVEIVAALLDAGADPSAEDRLGRAPLELAIQAPDPEPLIDALAAAGADPDRPGPRGTPLHLASEWGDARAVLALLAAGASVDPRNDEGRTPLMRAAAEPFYRHEDDVVRVVGALLEAGADVGSRDDEGRSPLHWAALGRSPRVIELLLRSGADPRLGDRWDRRAVDLLDEAGRRLPGELAIGNDVHLEEARKLLEPGPVPSSPAAPGPGA